MKIKDLLAVPIEFAHLAPLLFDLCINDISKCFLNSNYILYDDLKIYNTIRNLNDVRGLQDDIDRFYVWCINNKLSLNI